MSRFSRSTGRLLCLLTCAGVGCADDQGPAKDAGPDQASLEAALARIDAVERARCEALVACYPEVNRQGDDTCWGPVENGMTGWGDTDDPGEQAAERMCLERVYAREPEALIEFIDCLAMEPESVRQCVAGICPASIEDCGEGIEGECKRDATPVLAPVFVEECGYWDD